METNLEKAKRLVTADAMIKGIVLPDDNFFFRMLELAATPDDPCCDFCKHLSCSQYVEPCYGCQSLNHYEKAH